VVAKGLVVAAQAKQVRMPKRRRQQIALDSQAVAVATGHLNDWLQPSCTGWPRPMLDMRTMAVWLS